MVLSDKEIEAALQHKQLVITPDPAGRIGTSSVDLRLGKEFQRWRGSTRGVDTIIDPSIPEFFQPLAKDYLQACELERDGSVILQQHDFILGITEEYIELPSQSRLAARIEGRSTMARLGIGVHVTAPTIHSGFRGHVTLEIFNHGSLPVRLKPGLEICQLIVEQVFGTPAGAFQSIFQDQKSVTGGSKPTG